MAGSCRLTQGETSPRLPPVLTLAVFIVLTVAVATALKLAQERIPTALYRGVVVVSVVVPLGATLYAMWSLRHDGVGWREVTLFFGLFFATSFGVTLGFHRLLTHQSFKCHQGVRAISLALGSMASQGRCIDWAAYHLKHHAHSDRKGDPHSPLEGLFHAHLGWILRGTPAERNRYCKHLLRDPLVVFYDKTAGAWVALGLVFPYLVAGWSGLLWGGLVRIAFSNHVAFSVNSICHSFGERAYETGDESRNNWLMAVVALGEGWHNNHHAFPSMAYHGMTWRQFDSTALIIRMLVWLGLAWDVKRPQPANVERKRRTASASQEAGA
jgi:stearoyl-CoA desaturase (Delta-9 desaturase)